jgi:hypothetical protein
LRSTKENFQRASSKAVRGIGIFSSWPVFKDYRVDRVDGDLFVFAVLQHSPSEFEDVFVEGAEEMAAELSTEYVYSPLSDYPDLFLRFARLLDESKPFDEDEMLEIVLKWVKSYGVLGIEGVDPWAYRGLRRSARKESVAAFVEEAKRASQVLNAFEAVISDNSEVRMRDFIESSHTPFLGGAASPKEMRSTLGSFVVERVNEYIRRECEPPTLLDLPPTPATPNQFFSQMWGCKSLLGALYLQMEFYAWEPGMLRICKADDCDAIVTFEPGTPPESLDKGARGKYRTRSDKVYCSKACGQRMRDRKKKKRNS